LPILEPAADEFFATSGGVCVYVNVHARAFRVQFATPDAPGSAGDTSAAGASEAIAVARAAFVKHREKLTPLFERIAEASRP
jgi:hypothetical protein